MSSKSQPNSIDTAPHSKGSIILLFDKTKKEWVKAKWNIFIDEFTDMQGVIIPNPTHWVEYIEEVQA